MTVYVDNFSRRYRSMMMCHLAADTTEELHHMADLIKLGRKWIQHEGEWKEHYDVSLTKRRLAVRFGAQEVTGQQLITIMRARGGGVAPLTP